MTAGVLLVALGSDYNILLVGRVWDEAQRRPLREATIVAGAGAARAISAAGIVLAFSFAALALVPLLAFKQLAFVMAGGLLIDAFLVRTVLVPAVIALIGYPASGRAGACSAAPSVPGSRPHVAPTEVPASAPAPAAPDAAVARPVPTAPAWPPDTRHARRARPPLLAFAAAIGAAVGAAFAAYVLRRRATPGHGNRRRR